jgi:hypothetical protein
MAEEISLPSSSRGELEKIIKGYGHVGKEVDLDTLSKLTAIGRTTISANNPFLSQVGIITGGKKKQITESGKKLARAFEHNIQEQISTSWREVVRSNEFLSNVVSTIRIKGGMTPEDVMGHILFASGAKNTQPNRTGAKTVAELLILSGLVEENNGKLQVASPTPQATTKEDAALGGSTGVAAETPAQAATGGAGAPPMIVQVPSSVLASPTIAINIQLQLPETDKPEVYEELFKALRRHLFPG